MNVFTIKLIAVCAMAVDHTALLLWNTGVLTDVTLYYGLRAFGRLAFPLFAFLLVNGVRHTRSVWKYVRNLVLFGLLTQPAFLGVIFSGAEAEFLDFLSLNTLFTLAAGALLSAITVRLVRRDFENRRELLLFGAVLLFFFGVSLVFHISSDYGLAGLALILALSLIPSPRWSALAVVLWAALEYSISFQSNAFLPFTVRFFFPVCCVAALCLFFYNGERGRPCKYLFYGFYPGHLYVLWGLSALFPKG